MRKSFYFYFFIFLYLIMSISGCGKVDMKNPKYSMKADMTLSAKVGDINKIQLHNGVGDINVVLYEGDTILIDLKKTIRGNNKNEITELSKEIEIQAIESDGILIINTLYKKNDIWKWKDSNDKYDICMDYTIKVPKKVIHYSIKSGVGNIHMNNIEGQLAVATGVGDIKASNIRLKQNSQFKVATGEIDLNICSIIDTESVDIIADVGDIQISIPESIDCRLNIHEYMEKPQAIGNKGPLVTVKADLGDINIIRPKL